MSVYVVLTPDQIALELAADALLQEQPRDHERPFYTEPQLLRSGRHLIKVETLEETVETPTQALSDELRFLVSVTRMAAHLRRCLHLWIEGWSQREIAEGIGVSQQAVSRQIRCALRICYEAVPLSFRHFSRHTIYRRPKHGEVVPMHRCPRCDEEFPRALGDGRYCSSTCRGEAAHDR